MKVWLVNILLPSWLCLYPGDPGGAVLSLGAIVGIALALAVVLFTIIALAAFLMVYKRGGWVDGGNLDITTTYTHAIFIAKAPFLH